MLLAVIAYQLFAVTVVGAVAYHAYRQNVRDIEATFQRGLQQLERFRYTPPMPGPASEPAEEPLAEEVGV